MVMQTMVGWLTVLPHFQLLLLKVKVAISCYMVKLQVLVQFFGSSDHSQLIWFLFEIIHSSRGCIKCTMVNIQKSEQRKFRKQCTRTYDKHSPVTPVALPHSVWRAGHLKKMPPADWTQHCLFQCHLYWYSWREVVWLCQCLNYAQVGWERDLGNCHGYSVCLALPLMQTGYQDCMILSWYLSF